MIQRATFSILANKHKNRSMKRVRNMRRCCVNLTQENTRLVAIITEKILCFWDIFQLEPCRFSADFTWKESVCQQPGVLVIRKSKLNGAWRCRWHYCFMFSRNLYVSNSISFEMVLILFFYHVRSSFSPSEKSFVKITQPIIRTNCNPIIF